METIETMKVDNSWNRYMNYTGPDETPERYRYSISLLHGDVLDVGAGDGFGVYWMKKNENIRSITLLEPQQKAIDKIREHYNNIDIYKEKIEDFSWYEYNTIHCGHTLEHVDDPILAMENIKSMMIDYAIISIPLRAGLSKEHKREFKNKQQAIEFLQQVFKVENYKIFKKTNIVWSLVAVCKERR